MSEPKNHRDVYVSGHTRWVAIGAGFLTAVYGFLAGGWLSLVLPILLIAGAVVSPYSPREGRRLIRVCAILLSIGFFPLAFFSLRGIGADLSSYHDINILEMVGLSLATPLLVAWCDAALVVDALGRRRTTVMSAQAKENRRELLSFIAVAVFSYWSLPGSVRGIVSYGRIGRLDILLVSLAVGAVVVAYDIFVVIAAVKGLGGRQEGER
jgi:hypothetical protein